jgi:hypothetical protein
MSLLPLALGVLIPGGGLGIAILKFGAGKVFGRIGGAAKGAASAAGGVNWAKVLPLILIALLVIALLVTRHTLAGTKDHLAKEQARVVKLVDALQVTQTSLDGALGQINDNNKRIEAANAALQTARQEAAANDARANARYEATKGAVARLEASAGAKGLPPCRVSDEARRAMEGL